MKIELINIGKKFKNNEVLKNINLTIYGGEIFGLYGRNGSGKSLLLKIIAGFVNPTSGKVLINGKDYINNNYFYPHLRCLIENPDFFPNLTGYENLRLLAEIQNKINKKDIIYSLKIVNLYNDKDRKYKEYSLGMKQKLGVAQAIMEKPNILILDEPFNGIDDESVNKIIKYLKRTINKNMIIIITTNIKEDLEKVANRIYYIDRKEEIVNEAKEF